MARGGPRWQSKRMWSSPPSTNMSKIHPLVEKFSWKTNWKLAAELLYNQGCKKDTHIIRQDGKKKHQVRTCAPGGGG